MEIEELAWFVALAEREHVSLTAFDLHISQPTLSRALARLERSFGVSLFDREGRRIRLNQYGRILRDNVVLALGELDNARRKISELTDPNNGKIRLGFSPPLGSWLIPELLAGFRSIGPDVQFELVSAPAPALSDRLSRGELDFIVAESEANLGGRTLRKRPLYREVFYLAVSADHVFARRREISLTEAALERFIIAKRGSGFRDLIESLCSEAGFEPNVPLENGDLSTILGLVQRGLGIAVIPGAHRLSHSSEIVFVPLSDAGARRLVAVAWLQKDDETPVVNLFRSYINEWSCPDLLAT